MNIMEMDRYRESLVAAARCVASAAYSVPRGWQQQLGNTIAAQREKVYQQALELASACTQAAFSYVPTRA